MSTQTCLAAEVLLGLAREILSTSAASWIPWHTCNISFRTGTMSALSFSHLLIHFPLPPPSLPRHHLPCRFSSFSHSSLACFLSPPPPPPLLRHLPPCRFSSFSHSSLACFLSPPPPAPLHHHLPPCRFSSSFRSLSSSVFSPPSPPPPPPLPLPPGPPHFPGIWIGLWTMPSAYLNEEHISRRCHQTPPPHHQSHMFVSVVDHDLASLHWHQVADHAVCEVHPWPWPVVITQRWKYNTRVWFIFRNK